LLAKVLSECYLLIRGSGQAIAENTLKREAIENDQPKGKLKMNSTLKTRFLATQKKLRTEERKMDAGQPHGYGAAYQAFCEAQRELESAGFKS
jgi:hypothetical protein